MLALRTYLFYLLHEWVVSADYVYGVFLNENKLIVALVWRRGQEAVFLVVCDPSVNEQ
jgi:hypothetical protein